SAAICASAVRDPVPRSTLPLKIVIRLSGSIVSQESAASFATDLGARSVFAPAGSAPPNIEKPMARAPLAFRKSRRSNEACAFRGVMSASSSRRCRALDRGDDALMRAAATEIPGERLPDLRVARAPVLLEERGGSHDHPVDAVPTLRGLLVDERLLELRGVCDRAEPLERGDRATLDRADRQRPRAHCRPVHHPAPRTPLPNPAPTPPH